MGVGPPTAAQYLPPLFKGVPKACPPQTIISLLVQTAVRYLRPEGALMLLVALQLSMPGSYLPPPFAGMETPRPPQTIISLPVHTDASCARCSGAPVMLVAVQLSVSGLYRPPVFSRLPLSPPQTIISLVVLAHTGRAKCAPRGRICNGCCCPTARAEVVAPAGVEIVAAVPSAPKDHFAAGPYCRVINNGQRAHW